MKLASAGQLTRASSVSSPVAPGELAASKPSAALDAMGVAEDPLLTPALGPTAIAIHDDCHVLRHAVRVDAGRLHGPVSGLKGVGSRGRHCSQQVVGFLLTRNPKETKKYPYRSLRPGSPRCNPARSLFTPPNPASEGSA